jgi:hypothetical protein
VAERKTKMYYTVIAKIKESSALEFLSKLTDGTIESQKPDGKEIIASMDRARINDEGLVQWSEACYCATPLEHERQTVYDHYFLELQTQEVDQYVDVEGRPFMEYLKQLAGQ